MIMLTPYDIAERLQVSYDTVLSLIKQGEIAHVKVGRQYRVSEKALADFINGETTASVKSNNKNIYNNRNTDNRIKLRRLS